MLIVSGNERLTLSITLAGLLVLLCQSALANQRYHDSKQVSILMPHTQPKERNTYLCTSFDAPQEDHYVVRVTPNASMDEVHHVLILGCEEPGYSDPQNPSTVWECWNGENETLSEPHTSYPKGISCKKGIVTIYNWGYGDATPFSFPDKSGYKVGAKTSIPKIVVQVHYKHVDRYINGDTDQSGAILTMVPASTKQITRKVNLLILGTDGLIQPNSTENFETKIEITQPLELHPFAFRVHTHKLGISGSGWLIHRGHWRLIGKADPRDPQIFRPIEHKSMVIRQNDTVAARCTMSNPQDHLVPIGPSEFDEMCNYFVMYWVEEDKEDLQDPFSWSDGPPKYYWSNDANLRPIPQLVRDEA